MAGTAAEEGTTVCAATEAARGGDGAADGGATAPRAREELAEVQQREVGTRGDTPTQAQARWSEQEWEVGGLAVVAAMELPGSGAGAPTRRVAFVFELLKGERGAARGGGTYGPAAFARMRAAVGPVEEWHLLVRADRTDEGAGEAREALRAAARAAASGHTAEAAERRRAAAAHEWAGTERARALYHRMGFRAVDAGAETAYESWAEAQDYMVGEGRGGGGGDDGGGDGGVDGVGAYTYVPGHGDTAVVDGAGGGGHGGGRAARADA